MDIFLVRHTAVDVPKGVCYGQTDVPLAPSFAEEAALVKEKLRYIRFEAVYTSPLSRCTRLADFCGYPTAIRDQRILELHFGDWEMQSFDQIADPRLQAWYDDYLNVRTTGGESFMDQYERVSEFLETLKQRHTHSVLVFAHGGVLGCAKVYAGLSTPADVFAQIPAYGEVLRISL